MARGLEESTLGAEGQTRTQATAGKGSHCSGSARLEHRANKGQRASFTFCSHCVSVAGFSGSEMSLHPRNCSGHAVSGISQQEAISALHSNHLRDCVVWKRERNN